jgi:hypothetical protein
MEVYDAFSLSPITVVAYVLASHPPSASRISSATASAAFAALRVLRVLIAWLAQICDMRLVAARGHREKPSRLNRPALRGQKARPLIRFPRAPCSVGAGDGKLMRGIDALG